MAKEKKNIGFQELDDSSIENVSGGYIEHRKGTEVFDYLGNTLSKEDDSYHVYTNDGQLVGSFGNYGFMDAIGLDMKTNRK